MKRQLAIEVEKLASGVVLLCIADELAWTTFIDGKDCETIGTKLSLLDCGCPD
jgi:superkiller protein 3